MDTLHMFIEDPLVLRYYTEDPIELYNRITSLPSDGDKVDLDKLLQYHNGNSQFPYPDENRKNVYARIGVPAEEVVGSKSWEDRVTAVARHLGLPDESETAVTRRGAWLAHEETGRRRRHLHSKIRQDFVLVGFECDLAVRFGKAERAINEVIESLDTPSRDEQTVRNAVTMLVQAKHELAGIETMSDRESLARQLKSSLRHRPPTTPTGPDVTKRGSAAEQD